MNYIRCTKTVLLIITLVTFIGCNSKQDKPGAPQANSGASPRNTGEIKSISGQNTTGAPALSPQDQADARAAAARVLAQLEAADFAAIYKEAAPGFQKIGSDTAFVTKFQQTRQKTGAFKKPKEINFGVSPEKAYMLIYGVENDRYKSEYRLTFTRAQNGKMILEGLNQHDELKK